MNNSEYAEKLRDPRWQKVRLRIFERDGWKCRACRNSENTLCVHHLIYIKGKEPWDYPDSHLETLCEDCHEFREEWNDFFGRSLVPTGFCRHFCFAICRPLFDIKYQGRFPQKANFVINELVLWAARPENNPKAEGLPEPAKDEPQSGPETK